MKRTLAAAVIAAAAICASAQAQNVLLDPAFGTVNLRAGFTPDPYAVNIVSGGNIDVSRTVDGCVGMIADAPDVRLNYQAGGFDLYINAISNSDTTLVVNAPDGSWWCDDDSGGDLNPALAWSNPMSGQYDIWVGSYGGGNHNARLEISEIGN